MIVINWAKTMSILYLALLTIACFANAACNGSETQSVENAASRASDKQMNSQKEGVKVRLKIGDKDATAILNDSEAARDFISLLPLDVTLRDYNKTEKVSDLPKRLSTEGSPPGSDPEVGTIAYYAPWGNLAIFYRDFSYSNGLVILGKIDKRVEVLNTPGPVTATIELVK